MPQLDINILNITNNNIIIMLIVLGVYVRNVKWKVVINMKMEKKMKVLKMFDIMEKMREIVKGCKESNKELYVKGEVVQRMWDKSEIRYR